MIKKFLKAKSIKLQRNQENHQNLKNQDLGVYFFNKNICKGNCYQHGKLILADGKKALISTGNFSESSLCRNRKFIKKICHRDFSITSDDPKVIKSLKESLARNDFDTKVDEIVKVLKR